MPFVNDTKQFEQLTLSVKAYSAIQIAGYSLFASSLVTKSRGHLTGALALIIGSVRPIFLTNSNLLYFSAGCPQNCSTRETLRSNKSVFPARSSSKILMYLAAQIKRNLQRHATCRLRFSRRRQMPFLSSSSFLHIKLTC